MKEKLRSAAGLSALGERWSEHEWVFARGESGWTRAHRYATEKCALTTEKCALRCLKQQSCDKMEESDWL